MSLELSLLIDSTSALFRITTDLVPLLAAAEGALVHLTAANEGDFFSIPAIEVLLAAEGAWVLLTAANEGVFSSIPAIEVLGAVEGA